MRITVRLETKTCIVYGFGDIIYLAPVTDRLAIHEQMEKLTMGRQCDSISSGSDGEKTFYEISFTLASRLDVPELPSEEALVTWLGECKSRITFPGSLVAVVTMPNGKMSTLYFDCYEDAIERVLTGEHWNTTDINEVIAAHGALYARWRVDFFDRECRKGEYVAAPDAAELFQVGV